MKVASFNLRNDNSSDVASGNAWTNRYPVIANMILFHDLDIVGTQECKTNQIVDLKKAFSKFNYDFVGRARGTNPTDDEYSAIFYKSDRFKLISSGDFWLSETPNIPSKGWDAALNRICSWVHLEDIATGFIFYTFNLHMDHVGVEARIQSSKLVIEKIKEIAKDEPVLLVGVFNTDQYDEGYKIITSSSILTDCYTKAEIVHDTNGTFNSFNVENANNQRIDHVFASKHFTTTRYGVLTDIYWTDKNGTPTHLDHSSEKAFSIQATVRLPSDHFPVVVGLMF
jgi:endonuclease/exonuclease/phosphatase family metal-dependent hydrolase